MIGLMLIYVALCVTLFVLQRSSIYFPQPGSVDPGVVKMTIESDGERLQVSIRPHEGRRALFGDGLALFDRVHADHPDIEVIGRSLGSGVAVYVASQRPVERLVLVTPYGSLAAVAAEHYPFMPVNWLLRDKFESGSYAPRVSAPTTIVAAENDEVIPKATTEALRSRFREGLASYYVVPGVGHNTISGSAEYLTLLHGQ